MVDKIGKIKMSEEKIFYFISDQNCKSPTLTNSSEVDNFTRMHYADNSPRLYESHTHT